MIVDTHAHLTSERFAGEVEAVIARARAAGVDWMVTIASDVDDAEAAIELASRHEGVFATAGIHPHAADRATPQSFARIRELAARPEVVAIGETGLDFHYDNSPRDVQVAVFRRHLELAAEANLPAVVHARDADEEVGRLLLEVGWKRGVLHCFSGGRELLDLALSLDWYISFAGMITFPKWESGELLRAVPRERLLVETDSPYLAPVPHRGKRNEPANVRLVAERAAELRSEETDLLMAAIAKNARDFYQVER
ncbi:MAG TPA: TatD family hydrolase [Longimicrobiaceae bacterium]|nr:TatD family hydrolase [Longimicrobiaceae bacterium]